MRPDLGATGAILAASMIVEDPDLTVDVERPLLFRRSFIRRLLKGGRLHDIDTTQLPDPAVYRLGERFVAHPATAGILRAQVRGRLR